MCGEIYTCSLCVCVCVGVSVCVCEREKEIDRCKLYLSRYGGDGATEHQVTDHDPSQQVCMSASGVHT